MNAESPLAPELTNLVERAQAELERSVTEAKLHDDPIRFPLQAISTTLQAIHRLFVDGSLAIAQAAKAPQTGALTDEQFKDLARRLGTRLEHSLKWEVRAIGWKPVVYGVLAGIVWSAVAFGAGTWWESLRSRSQQRWADAAYAECKKHASVDKSGPRICTLTMSAE